MADIPTSLYDKFTRERIALYNLLEKLDDAILALASGNVAGRAFTILCENLHEGTRKIYDYTMKYRGLFGNFRRNLKRKI